MKMEAGCVFSRVIVRVEMLRAHTLLPSTGVLRVVIGKALSLEERIIWGVITFAPCVLNIGQNVSGVKERLKVFDDKWDESDDST